MHLALSRNIHWLTHLGINPTQPNPSFVKIPGSSLVLTTDVTLSRVQLLDLQDYNSDITQEVNGYKKADLIVSSTIVCNPNAAAPQIIGGITVSPDGHTAYILILTYPTAYITTLELKDRMLTQLPIQYQLPVDLAPMLFTDTEAPLDFSAVLRRFGEIAPINEYLTGAGIVYSRGKLHALTNRNLTFKAYRSIEETILIRRASIIRTPEQVKKYSDWQKRGLRIPASNVIEPILLDTDTDVDVYPHILSIPSRYGGTRKLYKNRLYTLEVDVEGGEVDSVFIFTLGSAASIELKIPKQTTRRTYVYKNQKMARTGPATVDCLRLQGDAKLLHVKVILSPGIVFDGHFAYHFTMLEEARTTIRFSLLTSLHANTGELANVVYLPIPDLFDTPAKQKAVYHGIASYDNELYILRREDSYASIGDPSQWELSRGTYFSGLDLENGLDEDLHYPVGLLNWRYGATPDGQPVQETVQDTEADGVFDYLRDTPYVTTHYAHIFKSIDANQAFHTIEKVLASRASSEQRTPLNKPMSEFTGECALVKIPVPQAALPSIITPTLVTQDFPWGVVTPFAINSDEADRKFYALLGDHIWTFDTLDFTLCVNHGGTITEGDIIDFDDVLDAGPVELSCFIRNDAAFPLHNVVISIVQDPAHPRWDDGFLRTPGGTVGSKTINLGSISTGQSREFSVRLYCLDVKSYEEHQVYRLPLRVVYTPEI